jgi:hypothetical protein
MVLFFFTKSPSPSTPSDYNQSIHAANKEASSLRFNFLLWRKTNIVMKGDDEDRQALLFSLSLSVSLSLSSRPLLSVTAVTIIQLGSSLKQCVRAIFGQLAA